MRFTLLGSGTSTGVPIAGCQCAVCQSKHPRNFRNRTAGLIELPSGFTILVDAGPDLRHQCIAHRVTRIDAVLYTHGHADHILGTDDLRSFNFISRKRISCYGTTETLASLRRAFSYIFDPEPMYLGGMLAQLDLHDFEPDGILKIDEATLQVFSLPHGNVNVTGFRIGELAYLTDFKGLPAAAEPTLRGVKHLFIDGIRYEPHPTHNSIDEAVEIARSVGAERTYIIHTTHSVDYETVNPALPEGVELGYDGLALTFSA